MKLEKFVSIIPTAIVLFSCVASYAIVSSFVPIFPFSGKDKAALCIGAFCMLALIRFKKERMGFNKTTMIWFLFVVLYFMVAIWLVDPMAWGTIFSIVMIPFISDAMPARLLYRKFDATKL